MLIDMALIYSTSLLLSLIYNIKAYGFRIGLLNCRATREGTHYNEKSHKQYLQ